MQSLEDDTDQVEDGYANTEYVDPEDPHPDKFKMMIV